MTGRYWSVVIDLKFFWIKARDWLTTDFRALGFGEAGANWSKPPLSGSANHVELHEVGGAADAHGCACNDANDVAFAHQAFIKKALFGDGGEAVNLWDLADVTRHDAPDQGHAAAGFRFRRERDDGNGRGGTRNQARGK